MIEIMGHGYYENAQPELSNEYKHDRVKMVLIIALHSCALDESNLSIIRVNPSNAQGINGSFKKLSCFLVEKVKFE